MSGEILPHMTDERLRSYGRVILIDAIASDMAPRSTITSELSELPDVSALHTASVHDTSL